MTFKYCDCNVFFGYDHDGESALTVDTTQDRYVPEAKMADYKALAETYSSSISSSSSDKTSTEQFQALLSAAERAMNDLYHSEDDEPTYAFDINKALYIWCNLSLLPFSSDGIGAIYADEDGDGYTEWKTSSDELRPLQESLAKLFGFSSRYYVSDFCYATGKVFYLYSTNNYRSIAKENPLALEGAVYASYDGGYFYIFPYVVPLAERGSLVILFFSGQNQGQNQQGILVSDWQLLNDLFENPPENYAIQPEGRCLTSELALTRLTPVTKTVVDEYGNEVKRIITSGKDFIFVEQSDATNHLIHEDRETDKFISDLTGTCAEEAEGYDESDYVITTNRAEFEFCDCDPFASLLKTGGVASEITTRKDRNDYAQMTSETATMFDTLSALYEDFISRILTEQDVDAEWRIGVTNSRYSSYKAFFDYAQFMMAWANRNLGKNNEYVLSESVIVGINRGFVVTINGNGNNYDIDQYRKIVASLFGYSDVSTFTTYASTLANELKKNEYYAGTDTMSARLTYDGAIYTNNNYFVLPFVIQSELSKQRVFALVFVDADGNMSVWLNDARNAFNAVNFGNETEVLDDGDKFEVVIYGRCLICEDDGYYMKADLDSRLDDMLSSLQGLVGDMYFGEEVHENCTWTNFDTDEDAGYLLYPDADVAGYYAYYGFCDCDPFVTAIRSKGESVSLTKRVDRGDYASILPDVAADFDALSTLYKAFFSNYVIEDNGVNDWKIGADKEYYLEYKRFFKYAKNMYAFADNRFGDILEYILTDSALVGLNKSFAVSGNGNNYTVEDYRMLVSKLFGFNNLDDLTAYTDVLARAFVENERNANAETDADRLIYDGAVYTQNGIFVLPYVITRYALNKSVLAFVFVDTDGTMAIWINDVDNAFEVTDLEKCGPETRGGIFINGRCALFEDANYTGYMFANTGDYVAVERVKTFSSDGDFLVYSPFSDDEGFEVYWFSLYEYDLEVIYEEYASEGVGTVHQGVYTFVKVISADAVRDANQTKIARYEAGEEEEWY